ncbi:MAG TPA: hypothetical protein VFJ43_14200, partial [Bacteroidia bacterium]|nr:hypothetical protein [Bacteroidia bacterium]
MKHIFSLSAALLCVHIFAQKPEQFQSADLSFVPNKGQFVTDEQKPAANVQFKANVHGLEFYITDSGISYVFVKQNRDDYDPALGGKPNPDFKPSEDFARVDMNLLGATIDRNKVETEFPTANKFNYYYAHCPDGILGLSGYHQLTYKNVYPNIDWVITCSNHSELKYSFIVHPGGNPADIKLEYKYADVKVSDDNIVLTTPMGEISEQQLYCYSKETGLKVSANYDCRGNYVSINAAAPKGETLVIDPPLVWATYWGGSGSEQPQALVCSGTGEYVFVSGYSGSTTYPTMNPGGG